MGTQPPCGICGAPLASLQSFVAHICPGPTPPADAPGSVEARRAVLLEQQMETHDHGDCPACDALLELAQMDREDLRAQLEEARRERDEANARSVRHNLRRGEVIERALAAEARAERLEAALRKIAGGSCDDGSCICCGVDARVANGALDQKEGE